MFTEKNARVSAFWILSRFLHVTRAGKFSSVLRSELKIATPYHKMIKTIPNIKQELALWGKYATYFKHSFLKHIFNRQ